MAKMKKSMRPVPRPARGMEASPRPTPRPSTAKERASADAALRASQREAADRDMGMKYGGKVKKMRAGGGNMSSASLKKRITDDSLARDRAIGDTYEDRGAVGRRQARKEADREVMEWLKDKLLIDTYGRDAPNARSFNTRRAAGGAVKKMKAGGKCRGMGKATRGGNYSRG